MTPRQSAKEILFTYDDLKILKGWIEMVDEVSYDQLPQSKLKALIARLEAAELLANCLTNHEDLDPIEITEIKKWRKVCGK